MSSVPLPDYARPPVDEVVCGVRFEFLKKLRITHIGLLWEEFKDEFPRVEHAAPLVPDVSSLVVDEATGAPLPRAWFISKSDDYLVQFQGDHLLFNWRKRGADYPRYNRIFPAFLAHVSHFRDFVAREELGPVTPVNFELTYVNRILEEDGQRADGTMQPALSEFVWAQRQGRFLPSPTTTVWQLVFDMPENFGTLSAKARPVTRRSDEKSLMILELTAKGLGSDRSFETVHEWFDCAHEWIVRGFADLTSLDFQKSAWGRNDGPV